MVISFIIYLIFPLLSKLVSLENIYFRYMDDNDLIIKWFNYGEDFEVTIKSNITKKLKYENRFFRFKVYNIKHDLKNFSENCILDYEKNNELDEILKNTQYKLIFIDKYSIGKITMLKLICKLIAMYFIKNISFIKMNKVFINVDVYNKNIFNNLIKSYIIPRYTEIINNN